MILTVVLLTAHMEKKNQSFKDVMKRVFLERTSKMATQIHLFTRLNGCTSNGVHQLILASPDYIH